MKQPGVWEEIAGEIRQRLHPETFERWFGSCVVKEEMQGDLKIEVPSIFYRNWILEHYGAFIQEKLRQVAGAEARLTVEIAGDGAVPPPLPRSRQNSSKAVSHQKGISENGSKLNPKYTFDNFVEGSCNHFARAASRAAAEAPGQAYSPLFIYGGVGLGKTHLMQAIGHFMLVKFNEVRVHYVSSESFTNHLINSLQSRKMDQFRRSYRDVNALLIDDIQFLSGKERTQEEFFHTFNALFDLSSQIVITSDRAPSDLPNIENRLVSRFQSGLVVDLQVPDLETRVAILLNNAPYLRISLPEDVAFFIADKVKLSIRALEGALVRVSSYASLMKHPLTVGLAQHVLKDLLLRQDAPITIDAIQKKVAECFDIRVADMKTNRRPKTIAYPRQIAMYLCREPTAHSLQEIGEAFGGRNHATVIHAHREVERRASSDAKLRALLSRIRDEMSRV